MTAETPYLFTYGTLRKGTGNQMQKFLEKRSQWMGQATCQGKLYFASGHPAVIDSQNPEERVTGDLYQYTSGNKLLTKLDYYEGYISNNPKASLYLREIREVRHNSSDTIYKAWIYLFNQPLSGAIAIPSGDYFTYLNSNH